MRKYLPKHFTIEKRRGNISTAHERRIDDDTKNQCAAGKAVEGAACPRLRGRKVHLYLRLTTEGFPLNKRNPSFLFVLRNLLYVILQDLP